MPYFSFSLKEKSADLLYIHDDLKKISINKTYYSKNTELWKLLNKKKFNQYINQLSFEKINKSQENGKKILFLIPPNIGFGDALEYSEAINIVKERCSFDYVCLGFLGKYSDIINQYFSFDKVFPIIISKKELDFFDIIFHTSYEVKSFKFKKYNKSNIKENILKYFKISDTQKKLQTIKNKKIKRISVFPISKSPIRIMPVKLINEIIEIFSKKYKIEILFESNSILSKTTELMISQNKYVKIIPKNPKELMKYLKDIEFGIFMDSGPLHGAKFFKKRGIFLETSVSSKILLKNYYLIKAIKNHFISSYCSSPCGLVNVFNYNNALGCFETLKVHQKEIKYIINAKNIGRNIDKKKYNLFVKNNVGCIKNLNIKKIINLIKKEILL